MFVLDTDILSLLLRAHGKQTPFCRRKTAKAVSYPPAWTSASPR
jgi:hypothetical protein